MSKSIGPTFEDELKAAGLFGLPFSCGDDGSFSWGDVSDEQKAAVLAVYDAHDPNDAPPPRIITPLQFIELFTQAEQDAIAAAAQANAAVNLWLIKAMGAQEINKDDPRTIAGLDALVVAGLLTQERRDAILS
jgi:hypothetical protein